MANVTPSERELAVLMDADTRHYLRRGITDAMVIGDRLQRTVLRAYRSELDPLLFVRPALEPLVPLIAEGMATAHCYGIRRARLLLPAGTIAAATTVYRKTLEWIRGNLELDEEDITVLVDHYGKAAVQVVDVTQQAIETRLRETLHEVRRQHLHVKDGVKEIRKAFEADGLTPNNSYTLENLFRTQTQLAYSAGRWEQEQDEAVQEIIWGYKYVTVGDDRVRDSHIGLDGVTLPKDDPWWHENRPPNGYSCRCQVIPIYDERKVVSVPTEVEVNGKIVPQGADEGFKFNPGEMHSPLRDRLRSLAGG